MSNKTKNKIKENNKTKKNENKIRKILKK